jgi:hypothetical protein
MDSVPCCSAMESVGPAADSAVSEGTEEWEALEDMEASEVTTEDGEDEDGAGSTTLRNPNQPKSDFDASL